MSIEQTQTMKPILLLLLSVMFWSCLESNLDTTDKITDNDINYLGPDHDIGDSPNDPYRIVGITPSKNTWKVIVEYTGGCNEHHFYTWWNGNTTGNNVALFLFHNSNGDSCEAIVRDTINVDIHAALVNSVALEETTVAVVNAKSLKSIRIDPYLALLPQGSECSQIVSLLGTSCGEGIWDNQWMLLADTFLTHEKVWFQPVKNSTNVEIRKPESGNYSIAITLLFGFQYDSSSDATCQSLPEGAIVPVAIDCLDKL